MVSSSVEPSHSGLGCGDGNCFFRNNKGQVTNGGCTCIRKQSTYIDGFGWVLPAKMVKKMIEIAIAVDREKREK